jgi:hypothetical protein
VHLLAGKPARILEDLPVPMVPVGDDSDTNADLTAGRLCPPTGRPVSAERFGLLVFGPKLHVVLQLRMFRETTKAGEASTLCTENVGSH